MKADLKISSPPIIIEIVNKVIKSPVLYSDMMASLSQPNLSINFVGVVSGI